jgi:D-threonate/D-erythronate kinase
VSEVAVIADDLTGACDTGIAFAVVGLPTFVAFGDGTPPPAQIVAFDTDTRRMERGAAVERVRAAARRAYRDGARTLYKKIDSTLRGHVAAETAALLEGAAAEGHERALVVAAPAFPPLGRTTRGGRVFVRGTPLEETEVWRDSGMTGSADMVQMFRGAGLRATTSSLGQVRSGDLAGVLDSATDVAVCDAEEDGDLLFVARAGARLRRPVIWLGSGGLARHLPAALELRPHGAGGVPSPANSSGPVLTLVGSRSSVSREQARRLGEERGVETLTIEPAALLQHDDSAGEAVRRALASGNDLVVLIGLGGRVEPARESELAIALGRIAAEHAGRIAGLVATGGDTARGALTALGASGIWLEGEVEPGVPLGIANARPPLPLVTKAGAFGNPDTLRKCRARLRGTS